MFLIAAILGMAAAAAAAFFLILVADRMTGSRRQRVQGTPADLGLRYEEIQFLTADRLTLRGWYLESPGARATVVLVHDAGANRADHERHLLHLQRDYIRRGFSVFAFDLRGHGESAGHRDSLGRHERLDVQAAVAYVRRRSGQAPVLLHGFGFGAAIALEAVSRGTSVTGVIADSPFTTMRSHLRERWGHLPQQAFDAAVWIARRWFKADPDALAPIRVVGRIEVPVLFIHNEGDREVPIAHTLNLAAASLDPRDRVWIVPGREGHATGYAQEQGPYMRRCLEFVDEVIPVRIVTARAV